MVIYNDNDFRDLYQSLDVFDPNHRASGLHEICPCKDNCWKDALHRIPPKNEDWNEIYRPWIGMHYDRIRILVLAINMNEWGGFDSAVELVEHARDEIQNGRTRVRFGNDYRRYSGTMLYHRMGAYASAFVSAAGLIPNPNFPDAWPTHQHVATSFDYLSYTNHVKCSPHDEPGSNQRSSEPTTAMWRNCGKQVLTAELQVLKPKIILVLGKDLNFSSLQENVFSGNLEEIPVSKENQWQHISVYSCVQRNMIVFRMPHPGWPKGGTLREIYFDLAKAVTLTRELWLTAN